MFAAASDVEPLAGIFENGFRDFESGHARAVQRHVLPAGDGGVGVGGLGGVAPAALRALGENDEGDGFFRRCLERGILAHAVGFAERDGGDAVGIHPTRGAVQVSVRLLLSDQPVDSLADVALILVIGGVAGAPAVEAKQREAGAGGVVIAVAAVLARVPAAFGFLVAREPFEREADGAFSGVRAAELVDGFLRRFAALFLDQLGQSAAVEFVFRRFEFAGQERVGSRIGAGQLQRHRGEGACAFELRRSAGGFEAAVRDDGIAAGVFRLHGGSAGLDFRGFGLFLGRGVGGRGVLGQFRGGNLRDGFRGHERVGDRVGLLHRFLLLGRVAFLELRSLRLGQHGGGQRAEQRQVFGRHRHGRFGGGGVGFGKADVGDERGLRRARDDGRRLGLNHRFEARNLEVALQFVGHERDGRVGHLHLLRGAFEREFFLRERVDADGDFRRLRLAAGLHFLGDEPDHHEEKDEQVDGRGAGEALVVKAGQVAPALEQVDEGDERGEGEEQPPQDVAEQCLELLPARVVGVAENLARGGPVKAVVLLRQRAGVGQFRAEEQVEAIHAHGGIGGVARLEIEVHFFRRLRFARDDTAEVNAKSGRVFPVAIGGEKDVVAAPGECRLGVVGGGVQRADGLGGGEFRQRRQHRFRGRFRIGLRVGCGRGDGFGGQRAGDEDVLAFAVAVGGEKQARPVGGRRGAEFGGGGVERLAERLDARPRLAIPARGIQIVATCAAHAVGGKEERAAILREGRPALVGRAVDRGDRLRARPHAAIPAREIQLRVFAGGFVPAHQHHHRSVGRKGGLDAPAGLVHRIGHGGCLRVALLGEIVRLRILPQDAPRFLLLDADLGAGVVGEIRPHFLAQLALDHPGQRREQRQRGEREEHPTDAAARFDRTWFFGAHDVGAPAASFGAVGVSSTGTGRSARMAR